MYNWTNRLHSPTMYSLPMAMCYGLQMGTVDSEGHDSQLGTVHERLHSHCHSSACLPFHSPGPVPKHHEAGLPLLQILCTHWCFSCIIWAFLISQASGGRVSDAIPIQLWKTLGMGPGGRALCLRALVTLAENLGLVPSSHMTAHSHLYDHFWVIWILSFASVGIRHACGTCT